VHAARTVTVGELHIPCAADIAAQRA
jgi:hypothetical protein